MILGVLAVKAAAGIRAIKVAVQCNAIKANVIGMLLLTTGSGTSGSGAESFLTEAIKWASAGVSAFGAGFMISGIIDFGEGNSQQSASKKNEGVSKLVGGIMVVLVGIVLVPKIRSIFPT